MFDQAWALLALLLALPIAWIARRGVSVGQGPTVAVGLVLRLAVLATLVLAISRPSVGWSEEAASVVVVMDCSASAPDAQRLRAEQGIREGAADRRDGDRLGCVTFAARPELQFLPTGDGAGSLVAHGGDRGASDIAAALRLALASVPSDTAARLLLVSDGNATGGDAAAAAALVAADGIPVDVVPLRYRHGHEVLVERLAAPARVRRGQSIDLRSSLRSTAAVDGRLELRADDEPVDLDPEGERTGFPVRLDPGANLVLLPAIAPGAGAHRFEVRFVPDDPADDEVAENNVGSAVVFVEGDGRVAIIGPGDGVAEGPLAKALGDAGIECVVVQPERAMREGLPWLAGFDVVVLADVARWEFDNAFDRALHAYCHDLGGGLVMLGGPRSFGAGGWSGSETARVLPVLLDPPQARVLLRMSIALVIDTSGSMGNQVRGTGMNQQEIACRAAVTGIRSLSRLDEVTVIGFSGVPSLVSPRAPLGTGEEVAARVLAMAPGGGTDLFPAMGMAISQLAASPARNRHMVILTDGQTVGDLATGAELARQAVAAGISVSTIGVGDASNDGLLKSVAAVGRGRFHAVDSQASADRLPQVFVREMAMEGRQLIAEGDFVPAPLAMQGGPLAGIESFPPIRGYVLAAPRGHPAELGAVVRTSEGVDPFIAWQNYGVGRSLAVTGDLSARWAPAWKPWTGFQPFCEQVIRWAMRPADDRSVQVDTRVEDGRAVVTVRAEGAVGGFAVPSRSEARVVDPSGRAFDLPLRQVGVGRFEGGFDASGTGAWLVSVVTASERMDGSARARISHGSISLPYPPEFRALNDDEASLRSIARRTGGRVIELDQLRNSVLFDRVGMAPSRSSRQLWALLAAAAAVLLVLDVAWRRLAFDRRDARELIEVAIGAPIVRSSDAGTRGASPVAAAPRTQRPAPDAPPGIDTLSRLGASARRRRGGEPAD